MQIVDSQVHAPSPAHPWAFGAESGLAQTAEAILAAMDAIGVAAAIIAPRHDTAAGEYAARHYPDRLARVAMLDPADPAIDETVAAARADPEIVALRQVVGDYAGDRGTAELRAGKFDRLFAAAERNRMPVFLLAPGFPADMALIAEAYPDLTIVVDHFGLRQYPPLTMDPDPWEKLPGLLGLARYKNVAVKFCGPQLFSREPYPHRDVWPYLHRVIGAFGPERLIWASDFTRLRMVPPGEAWRGTYAEALHFVRDTTELGPDDKAAILGGTVRRLLGWPG